MKTPFRPDWASPPGDTLAELLDEHSMTQTELADRLGVSLKHVNRVVRGAASISADLALGLEKVFSAPASFWMTREAHYQADKARQQQRIVFAGALDWARQFPLQELRERGLIPQRAQGAELVEALLGFLGIAHPSQWQEPDVAYRKSQKFESDVYALAAWLREAERDAAEIDCEPYEEDAFLGVLQDVRALTRREPEDWWPELQRLCATAGVAVVVIPAYHGAKANGATRWLAPDKALIQLSLRYRWEDIFWFSFFHEAGHVVLHRKKERFVSETEKEEQEVFIEEAGRASDPRGRRLEEQADRFAARTLIPPPHDRRLAQLRLSEVRAFAQMIDIAPAIVVGRMQHEGLLEYKHGNDLRRRLKLVDD